MVQACDKSLVMFQIMTQGFKMLQIHPYLGGTKMKVVNRVKQIFFILIAFLTVSSSSSQPPEIEWSQIYGGDSSDVAYSVLHTIEGGYIFAGHSNSYGNGNDYYLVKTDSLGYIDWCHLYGGANNDEAYSLKQTSDGGYILVGNTLSFGDGIYLVKTDNHGDTLWTRTYVGTYIISARSGQQTSDGGYIVAGYIRPSSGALREMYLMKTDSIGDTLWTRAYGGTDHRGAYDIQQTTDDGYIIVGCNPFYGGVERNIYLVRIDSLGDTLWTRTYGGNGEQYALSVQQTNDGGYIIAGTIEYLVADIYVIKTDSLGDTLWTRNYGGTNGETASAIRQTPDEGYIIAGGTTSFGEVNGDLYLVKIDALGDTIWTLVYGGPDYDVVTSMDLTNDGGYIIAGYIWDWDYPSDAWLLKTGPDTAVSGAPVIQWVSHPKQFTLHPAYPNPFNPTTTISFHLPFQSQVSMNIYNVLGQRVGVLMDRTMQQGIHKIQWNGSNYPSGIYFIRACAGEFVQTRKVVLLK